MKILLDENIPKRLRFDFNIDDEVSTVQEMNWQGKKTLLISDIKHFNL